MAKGKQQDQSSTKKVSLLAKPKNTSSGKAKKKKWSKGKTREKLDNAVYFDQETYDKLLKEIPTKNKLITPSVISDKLRVNGSLARQAIRELEARGAIRRVGDHHHAQLIYTRYTQP
mmetsp:Transcript_1042/g.1638  ORF Transcript_1042/g.1638 Transcript_1042/m.1638 type:complete len:117 (-) Transcript_1042:657-1007(-)|eukprot:CAMPEP_0202427472 /NCGR_PEP_ID=MMETSP1345-20130828/1690_1 /ASSEMBLY_ACC=CAM_ASM_000843 /TAXON_ID=342563 /ORGANISM="Fabrea Fabrea salina" /LENGTH=116 /DNA_ID=CAMNT_0049038197 /DNA_START=984 /DNA_END=1334 /DNA_ORIENTATION=+